MTVKEMIALLQKMPADAKVVFPDTYEQNEGWEEGCDEAVLTVDRIIKLPNGSVLIDSDGDWADEDEDEDEDEDW